jgi:hypothetical protein
MDFTWGNETGVISVSSETIQKVSYIFERMASVMTTVVIYDAD